MKNKYLHIVLFWLILNSNISLGQNNKDKIQSAKIAFITQQLNLTPNEAEKFWPLYNDEQDKLDALKQKRKEFKKIKENIELASEKEIENYLSTEIYIKQREADIYKEYQELFRKILPPRKIVKLYEAEENFKRELIKQLKEK